MVRKKRGESGKTLLSLTGRVKIHCHGTELNGGMGGGHVLAKKVQPATARKIVPAKRGTKIVKNMPLSKSHEKGEK